MIACLHTSTLCKLQGLARARGASKGDILIVTTIELLSQQETQAEDRLLALPVYYSWAE